MGKENISGRPQLKWVNGHVISVKSQSATNVGMEPDTEEGFEAMVDGEESGFFGSYGAAMNYAKKKALTSKAGTLKHGQIDVEQNCPACGGGFEMQHTDGECEIFACEDCELRVDVPYNRTGEVNYHG